MLGPVEFVIDYNPKVFEIISSLKTNIIHGDNSMSVSFNSRSMKHHVIGFLNIQQNQRRGCDIVIDNEGKMNNKLSS